MTDVIAFFSDNPVAAVILAGEIAFWVFLFGGLAVRYLLRSRRVSTIMLISVPLIDVVVLVATYLHLRSGADPDFTHGLAAVYLGFSVAFGHSLLRWADQRFAHRFADGPPPWRPPKYGSARVRYEWREFGKLLFAWAITAGVIGLFVLAFGERAEPMWSWAGRLAPVVVIWFLVGPLWNTLSPPKRPADSLSEQSVPGAPGGRGAPSDEDGSEIAR